jgi:penicillin-binding protein-related factor A (putative recombinase)
MAKNRGKDFEQVIRECFERIDDVSIDRLHDQTNGYKGSQNICDFIVYRQPYEYYFECKSVHGNTLPFSNITETQWNGLLDKSQIEGVIAGIICWWIDKDVTLFIPIQLLKYLYDKGDKSVRYDCDWRIGEPGEKPFTFKHVHRCFSIQGKKKRVFFDYDLEAFLNDLDNQY